MKNYFSFLSVAVMLFLTSFVASAALKKGDRAPDFTLQGALAGKTVTFSLHKALVQGPVVLYFFPVAFSTGCTLEAHDFAEATDAFKKLGATVIGVTSGNLEQVAKFSELECRNKFAVAADPGARVAGEYQTLLHINGKTLSDRTSFVIAPDGKILLSYTDRNPDEHIARTMDAVKKYSESRS
ncbi:peroxiredoxin [Salmonella enterica]|nr:peroxiredoxin [Salmonella enterica]EJN1667703.1 peroxiredoxin [Salmonella enterica]EKJ5694750.1 peroxiredoxin [Salmonella enterica]